MAVRTLPEYRSWTRMRTRCLNPRFPAYAYYGGRGIRICDRWNSFQAFLSDMGPRPSPGHGLERLDNNGNYEPENVVWETMERQSRNRRSNIRLTYNGKTLCLSEWSSILGIQWATLRARLRKGWTVEHTLGDPIRPTYPRKRRAR